MNVIYCFDLLQNIFCTTTRFLRESMVGFYNIFVKALLLDVVLNDMTDRRKRAIKVLTENNSQLTDYRPEIQILTAYFLEMIFIEKSRMCEGSYGRIKLNVRNPMNREAALPATMLFVVANSRTKGPPKQYPESS